MVGDHMGILGAVVLPIAHSFTLVEDWFVSAFLFELCKQNTIEGIENLRWTRVSPIEFCL